METLNGIGIGYGAMLDYYAHMGLINRKLMSAPIQVGGIKVSAVAVRNRNPVSVFVFEEKGRKVIYAPCDCKPFPMNESLRQADLLIIGNTFIGDTLKNGRTLPADHPLREELHSMEDVLAIKDRLCIPNVILTHIEEDWGKSYDDYVALEEKYPDVKFAYDGMVVEV